MTGGSSANLSAETKTTWRRRLWREHEAIKNHLTWIAILVGGWWTYNIYKSLQQVKRADIEIRREDAELALLRRDPVANIELSATSLHMPGLRGPAIEVTASVNNAGRRIANLDFRKGPALTVVRLWADSEGTLYPGSPLPYSILAIAADTKSVLPLEQARLLPGEQTQYQFILPGLRYGLYLIQFSVPVAVADSSPGWSWTARTYYLLEQSRPTTQQRNSPTPCAKPRRGN